MKPTFPASYSTLCPDALAVLIAGAYPVSDVRCTFLVRGVGDTYAVGTDQGRFILRVYRAMHRSRSNVLAEVSLLLALQKADVSVSYPITDCTGETIQSIDAAEGERYAVLFSYATGQPIRVSDTQQLRLLGRELARFHLISSAIRLPGERWQISLETTLYEPLEKLKSRFTDNPDAYHWLQKAAGHVAQKLSATLTAAMPAGYCHFDCLPKNIHADKDTVTLFDFDFMGYGWLIYDLASFWQHLAIEVYAGRLTPEACREAYAALLSGYQEIRPVSEQELMLVPYLALGFWLFYMGFHTTHDQFYVFSQPAQLNVYVSFLKHLAATYWDEEP